ncbi:MAG: M1 family metallopeptidase [Chloroflexi bacterium]|nr:M1 family metallopeptidase [Chloroflexota bacterium]
MHPGRSRRLFAVLVLTLVLGGGLASTSSAALAREQDRVAPGPASPATEANDGTFTTLLQPGWNMAAWLGPDGPVSQVFDAIPELERVYAWDNEHERYQRAYPNSTPLYGLTRISTGMGLWLRIGGDSPVEWTRTPPDGNVLLSLSAGRNLVGWGGPDGEAFAESAARFGDALIAADRWNAATQRYERYRPDAEDSANTLRELRPGDALWVELTGDRRWWQSGLAATTFELGDELTEQQHVSLREDVTAVVTFFAEWYGIKPPPFTVEYHPDLEIFAGALPGRILLSSSVIDYALRDVVLAHEYFHILQRHFAGRTRSPAWMTEGTATYAGGVYRLAAWNITGEQLRNARWRHSRHITEPLRDLVLIRVFYGVEAPAYSLGAIAVEWLEGRLATEGDEAEFAPLDVGWPDSFTDTAAYIEYYRRLAAAQEWEDAFEKVFGISADDFYDAFEEYRDALYTAPVPSGG